MLGWLWEPAGRLPATFGRLAGAGLAGAAAAPGAKGGAALTGEAAFGPMAMPGCVAGLGFAGEAGASAEGMAEGRTAVHWMPCRIAWCVAMPRACTSCTWAWL